VYSENGDIAFCNKTIHNGIFVFFLKNKNLFLFIKNKKNGLRKQMGVFLKTGFFSALIIIFQSFFVIFP